MAFGKQTGKPATALNSKGSEQIFGISKIDIVLKQQLCFKTRTLISELKVQFLVLDEPVILLNYPTVYK